MTKVTIDMQRMEVYLGKQKVHLSSGEYRILEYFYKHYKRALHRNEIIDILKGGKDWCPDVTYNSRIADVYIWKLRCKLKNAQLIETVRDFGYRLGKDMVISKCSTHRT